MARSQSERLAEKTVERQFLHELENDFELAVPTNNSIRGIRLPFGSGLAN